MSHKMAEPNMAAPSVADYAAALAGFCMTIEASGGVKDLEDGVGCVADEDWLDLASDYLRACALLGREPKYAREE